jgi:hypothetical protein
LLKKVVSVRLTAISALMDALYLLAFPKSKANKTSDKPRKERGKIPDRRR